VSVKLKRSCENIMTHFVIFKEDTQISVACESQETWNLHQNWELMWQERHKLNYLFKKKLNKKCKVY